jgi:hypothetical protein
VRAPAALHKAPSRGFLKGAGEYSRSKVFAIERTLLCTCKGHEHFKQYQSQIGDEAQGAGEADGESGG